MKILYGVQTTGHGHIVRSREMITQLKAKGHEVTALLSGAEPKKGWATEVFEPYIQKRGLTFITERGRLKHFKTVAQLNFIRFFSDVYKLDLSGYDLVISDYEPITANAAWIKGTSSIGIGHLYAFRYRVPVVWYNPVAVFVMKYFATVRYPLGLHWHHFDQPLLPPTVPDDVRIQPNSDEKKVVVYLPNEKIEDIKAAVESFDGYRFYIYWHFRENGSEKNMFFRPFSREEFAADLCDCGGVICGGGFSLISEALHLGKKVLSKPITGQAEQEANAYALERLGKGMVMRELSSGKISRWLKLSSIEPMNYPPVLGEVIDWIGNGDWDDIQGLSRKLWNQTCIRKD